MRVLVLGGYGEFGGKVAILLLRDGHEVLVAGRSIAAARRFCAAHGGVATRLDVDCDLDRIEAMAPDAVVDAIGPYQASTSDPYRVPRAALAAGAHYLDLSDDAGFSAGINTLDTAARFGECLVVMGSDRGCMVVEVTGRRSADGEDVVKRWTLVADSGQGPFVPGVAVRAILRRADRIAPGARACLAECAFEHYRQAMSDLGVRTACSEQLRPSLFRQALGADWSRLSKAVRRLHCVQDQESFSGCADITRGDSWIARIAAALFRFPLAGRDVPVQVVKTRTASGENWERNFAGRSFCSQLTPAGPGRYRERFWPFVYEQTLPVTNGALGLPVCRGWLLGIPLPRALLPASESKEFEVDGQFHFDVSLLAPLGGGLIVRYRGRLTPDTGAASEVTR